MKTFVSLIMLCLAPSIAFANCGAGSSDCGAELQSNGWQEIARCDDGHQWGYVLEKEGQRKFCTGINALSGPEERPCTTFAGAEGHGLEAFKIMALKASQQKDAYDVASKEGRLDDYLKQQQATGTSVDCHTGFGSLDGQAESCDRMSPGPNCSPELLKGGWSEIAWCNDGHLWSHILQKGEDYRFCTGISAPDGPQEPCVPFDFKQLDAYKALTLQAQKQQNEETDKPVNCADGFGAANGGADSGSPEAGSGTTE